MKTRLITSGVGIVLVFATMAASAFFPEVFTAVCLLITVIGVREALRAIGGDKVRVLGVPCYLYGALILLAPYIPDELKMYGAILAASMIYLFVMFAILLKKHSVLRVDTACTAMILTMFISVPLMVLELVFRTVMKQPDGTPSYPGGVVLVIFTLGVAWFADGGAYFVGRAIGKHKMAPVLSPKKTIEGAVGGFVSSMVISMGGAYLYADVMGYAAGRVNYINLAVITGVCILMSMFGDISFSAVKRQYGIKDFGNLLPGHGGVLDRFDSVFFVCPTFYLLNVVLPILR